MANPPPLEVVQAPTAPIPSEDLAGGDLTPADEALVNLGLEEHSHRIALQRTVANSVLSIAVVLFIAAISFGGTMIYAVATSDGDAIHWHASILVAAFILPPTILIIALIRSAYQPKDGGPAKGGDSTPAVEFFKELVSALREVFKKD